MTVKKQKNGQWLVQIDRKGLKRVRRQFDTQKEADIFEREYLWNLKKPAVQIDDPRTLIELIGIWYKYHGINLADPEKFKRQLIQAAHDMGNPVAHRLTPELFVKYRYERLNQGARPITGKTFNNLHSLLAAMFNRLKKLHIIDYENPIASVDPLRLQEKQMAYLSLQQIDNLLAALKKSRRPDAWYVVNLCLRTGARWSEAQNLRRRQLHHGRVTYEKTKSKKIRTIPLDDDFFQKLVRFSIDKQPQERIFISSIESFRYALTRAGIKLPKGQSTHVLRHSFAAHFMMKGGDILSLQKILGHSDIKMTMRYAHLAPNYLNDAVILNPLSENGGKLAVKPPKPAITDIDQPPIEIEKPEIITDISTT